jgi:hypothetical protein
MSAEWEAHYRAALQETDAAKVPEACERARRAINERLIELAGRTSEVDGERNQLLEALRTLFVHQYKGGTPT